MKIELRKTELNRTNVVSRHWEFSDPEVTVLVTFNNVCNIDVVSVVMKSQNSDWYGLNAFTINENQVKDVNGVLDFSAIDNEIAYKSREAVMNGIDIITKCVGEVPSEDFKNFLIDSIYHTIRKEIPELFYNAKYVAAAPIQLP